jgi:galactonate dehydratase
VPFLLIHETAPNVLEWGSAFARKTWAVDREGYASLPEGPGLGVTMDERAMARVAANPDPRFVWPNVRLRDGSVTDY